MLFFSFFKMSSYIPAESKLFVLVSFLAASYHSRDDASKGMVLSLILVSVPPWDFIKIFSYHLSKTLRSDIDQ